MQQRSLLSLRSLALLAVTALTMAMLAACGGDNNSSKNTPTAGASGTAGSGGNQQIGSVDVLGIWGSDELTNFDAMVKPWQDQTGGKVNFTGTRDTTAQLTLRVEGNNPPDVAIPAEVGLFQQFAKQGKLTSLDQCPGLDKLVRDNYPKAFVDLGTVDGKLYGFFMKADTKATVWYNPTLFKNENVQPPSDKGNFGDLLTLSNQLKDKGVKPWSMGLESAETSGWPGTDWIQQIILNEEGEDTYDGIVNGSIKFTDAKVKSAWEKFGQIALGQGMTSQGGATGINATNFQDATYVPFQNPPGAAMTYLGGFASTFIKQQFPNAKAGTDYDFFTWPGGKVTGGANIVYAFNNDPTTCSFLTYLAGADAQEIWVKAGGFTSVNEQVDMASYPDDVARRQAEQLLNASTFRFDVDDAIGGAFQQAYFQGITQYLQSPNSLDSILQQIESARGK